MNRADLAKRRILVVEDEAIIAMLIEDIIEDLGCAVVGPVAQVEAALTVIDTDEIDGAVLDVTSTASRAIASPMRLRRAAGRSSS